MGSPPLFETAETSIPGCVLLRPRVHVDLRGTFVKSFHSPSFAEAGLPTRWAEDFWSISRHGVLRGLHFQRPPHAHAKLVSCLRGLVFDAIVDLRRGSPAFGRHETFTLDATRPSLLLVARGVAHGFQVLSDEALVTYKTGTPHAPESDDGVLWSSCGIDWPLPPIVSPRDAAFGPLDGYLLRPVFRQRSRPRARPEDRVERS